MFFLLILLAILFMVVVIGYLSWHFYQILPTRLTYRKTLTAAIMLVLFGLVAIQFVVFGFLANMGIMFVVFDSISLLVYKFEKPRKYWAKVSKKGISAIAISLLVSFYGLYNAQIIVTNEYNIKINKTMVDTTVVIASDLHLSTAVGQGDLDYFADQVEEMNPDMVFLVGDIYDESSKADDVQYSFEVFKRIAEKYPVYYVEGNHELGHGQVAPLERFDLVNNLTKSGVTVLLDEVVELENMYIIGRRDFRDSKRADMDTLMKGIDTNKPIILLDHQPKELKENSARGVDFQISGHTHGGQMFPVGQFSDLVGINEMNYGIRQIDDYHIVVTSGMGMWGYAMRTSFNSEILKIQFSGK